MSCTCSSNPPCQCENAHTKRIEYKRGLVQAQERLFGSPPLPYVSTVENKMFGVLTQADNQRIWKRNKSSERS